MDKTNVMRLLDGMGISYTPRSYPADGSVPSGVEAARLMGEDPSHVFKTLVTQGASLRYYVFVIPVAEELSLKKAAAAVGEKSIAMLKSKDLLPLTGYVHGGCSPIGMKKPFPTTLDETVELCDTVIFSAGKIGYQVEMTPADLQRAYLRRLRLSGGSRESVGRMLGVSRARVRALEERHRVRFDRPDEGAWKAFLSEKASKEAR